MLTRGPSGSSPFFTTLRLEAPLRERVRIVPQIAKRSEHRNPDSSFNTTYLADFPTELLALFGRRKGPAILIETQEDPSTPPITAQEDPADISPAAAREDIADIPPATPQQQIPPAPVPYEVDETLDLSSLVSSYST